MFEDYHKLDCEDVIGTGQIKTRFGYTKVSKEDFGLTEEEILLMDDKALNQLVSIKHYRPFRHQTAEGQDGDAGEELVRDNKRRQYKDKPVNIHRVIALKKQFKQQVQDRLDMVKQIEQNALEQEKSKYLKKDKKAKKEERRKADKLLKKRKHKEQKSTDRDQEEGAYVGEDEVDEGKAKKKKRMSLYGI